MSHPLPRSHRPRIAVTTVVHHEHAALLGQVDGLGASSWPPDLHVVLAASDRELARNRLPIRSDRWETLVPRLQVTHKQQQRAYVDAVMLAMDEAVGAGAQVLVHLDVRCIPAPDLLQAYAERVVEVQGAEPVLLDADVLALSPPGPLGYPVSSELHGWVRGSTDQSDENDVVPGLHSFALLGRDWPAVREAWEQLAVGNASVVTPADAVRSLGGVCARIPGTAVYHQHPHAARIRYTPATGDRLVQESVTDSGAV
ncbi:MULTISPECIES: hypothetical protein [unclassified Serinicoccus]|uniref:hypothetical protein n=1 Tax=unclassified Serinicoccus TaxID=2643101 RepID=UPI0038549F7D